MRRALMALFVTCLVAGAAPLPSAQATETVTSRRLAAADRYATAAAIALADRESAQVATLARGDDPADALAGSTLAGVVDGPILLTASDRLSRAALDAMTQLEVRRVNLLGGPEAISDGVAAELRSRGFEVARFAGADRYDTAARISASCGSTCGYPLVNGKRVALLVSGLSPADAAAASPVAAGLPVPLLLTERDRVPAVTFDALASVDVQQVLVVGGEAVVSAAAVRSLQDAGHEVRRLAGASRQETAAVLARYERDELGWVVDHVNLTRGDLIVDALAGGPHAGREQAPVLLTRDPGELGAAARGFLEESRASVGMLDVFGGEGAVSAAVVDAAERAAGKAGAPCPAPATNPATPAAPTTVARGLRVPWGLAVLPDGVALVSERDTARLRLVHPDGRVTDVGTVPGVVPGGEGGLLGIALSPTFSSDRLVYAYLTAGNENKVIRMPFDAIGSQVQTLVSGIPKASIHNGGRIAFGPDGMLYIGTGDAAQSSLAQDRSSLGGKVLRVRPDGSVPPDNPFPGSPVFSLGHRNVQGLGFDADGRLYATELGQNAFDEVNVLRAGGNYGWPVVEGRGGDSRFVEPVVIWTPAEASPSGAVVAAGSFWVAALRGQRLWQVQLDGAGGVGQVRHHFAGQLGRLRAVAQSPDCGLWVLTNESDARLLRIGLG
jgi:glucose/arabinose dehydrogenase/putative cell wall-binding protein